MDEPSTSGSTDNSDIKCSICSSDTHETIIEVKTPKGKQSVKKSSIERQDNLLSNIDLEEPLFVHPSCRKVYVNVKKTYTAKRKNEERKSLSTSPPKRKLRKSSDSVNSSNENIDVFKWKEECFICEKEANIENEKKKKTFQRKKIVLISSLDIIQNLKTIIAARNDDFHRKMWTRLQGAPSNIIDLGARYHRDCYQKLLDAINFKPLEKKDVYSEKLNNAMEEIYSFLLSSYECQFDMAQLRGAIKNSDVIPNEKTIISRLKSKFGEKIVVSSKMGGTTYVCFTNDLYDILSTAWYNRKKSDSVEGEENRVVDSAAELIRRKIRSTICRTDQYPASDEMLTDVNRNIPPQLLRLLTHVIYKDKEQSFDNEYLYSKKITSIAHAIMSAARPVSFISPLQLATGIAFHRKFGSRKIIEICHGLGFSSSYSEVGRYEVCATLQSNRSLKDPFVQIVSDNSDFNICTIDGRNTFHFLGSIEIIPPATALQKRLPIKRIPLSEIPKVSELVADNKIHIELYTKKAGSGLQNIVVESFSKDPSFNQTVLDKLNILWLYLKYVRNYDFIEWNGFMSMLTSCQTNYAVSKINFLPFINGSPSDYSTLYTVLKYASDIMQNEGMKSLIITFDQPLYIKARDIVAASNFYGVQIIVRLGCFHLLMSFMGCIGYIMAGSGLKDILSVIFAEGSVDKILDGHSYARAVRAHFILQQVLSMFIIEELKKDNAEFNNLLIDEHAFSFDMDIDRIQNNENFEKISKLYQSKIDEIEKRGKTCKLWILYYKMVSLLRKIIAAERMGNWKLHLECVELAIPFFHAAGHFNYAKSARLYLQDMRNLHKTMDPVEFKKFTDDGYFTSRRSNAFFSGIFSDQTIEQTLMRAMSVEGGPFKRGATTSVVLKWIKGVIYTKDIIECLEEYCNVQFSKSHQHVDARDASINKDKKDVLAVKQFLSDNNPFEDVDILQNIVTGLVGTEEINCYDAFKIGIETMKAINGLNFSEIKLSKKSKVIPLLAVNNKIKIGEKYVPVDPLLLFQRICVMKKSDEELESYMKFELAPYPLSLFDEVGMRKGTKSSLFSSFKNLDITLQKENCKYYVDGGMLLYKVKWPTHCKYEKVFQEHVNYLKRNFGNNITVVFDNYSDDGNKSSERYRRSLKVASKEFKFKKESKVTVSQEKFLSNYKNKSLLITYLIQELSENNIKCYQGEGEADELLVQVAIEDETNLNKVITAEDIDILVILSGRAKKEEDIYFLKLGKKNSDVSVYSSKSFEIGYPNSSKYILFMHSFTGCDSTSAFYNKGKKKFVEIVEKRSDVREKAEIFYDQNSTMDQILEAGQYCTAVLYGAAKDVQFNKLKTVNDWPLYMEKMRYNSFVKATTQKNAVKLSSLVASVDGLNQHIKRVYLQTQIWLGNTNINPLDWAWSKIEDCLEPLKMSSPPAPQELLKMIFCNCKKGCGSTCGCRKVGLFCNSTCKTCCGDNCENSVPTMDQGENEEEDESHTEKTPDEDDDEDDADSD